MVGMTRWNASHKLFHWYSISRQRITWTHLGLEGQVWNVPPLEHQTWQILELETFGSKHRSCYPESAHTHISNKKATKKARKQAKYTCKKGTWEFTTICCERDCACCNVVALAVLPCSNGLLLTKSNVVSKRNFSQQEGYQISNQLVEVTSYAADNELSLITTAILFWSLWIARYPNCMHQIIFFACTICSKKFNLISTMMTAVDKISLITVCTPKLVYTIQTCWMNTGSFSSSPCWRRWYHILPKYSVISSLEVWTA
jgi:hypothetical protein